MIKIILLTLLLCITQSQAKSALSNQPDSAYIFAYSLNENGGREGLSFAWSDDNREWEFLNHKFVHSDFGPWGSEKKMNAPFLFRDVNGLWHCLWTLNDRRGGFAYAASEDLVYWQRQSYPLVIEDGNCLDIEVSYDQENKTNIVSFLSFKGADTLAYYITTTDFKNYTPAKPLSLSDRLDMRKGIMLDDKKQSGTIHKVPYEVVKTLINEEQRVIKNQSLHNETAEGDSTRFAGLKEIEAQIKINPSKNRKISDLLMGVFFEDINYAADGGIYAELIQNRGFEYNGRGRNDSTWNSKTAWSLMGSKSIFTIETKNPVHRNNSHYAVLTINEKETALVNVGFDSIAVNSGERYFLSMFAKNPDNKDKKLEIRLTGKEGQVYGQTHININSFGWHKYEAEIITEQSATDAKLEIVTKETGSIALDMVSLFPEKTFKGRRNGLRSDLVQTIVDLNPRFIRFPGGCVAHGKGLENMYRWKNTIGPLEARKPQFNIWGYHQSYGLGYFEYFQLCEDIGAEPVPVVPAGVPCQNSPGGQQGGIPLSEMDAYVQDVLDLVEWANGDLNTTWGNKRAQAGHPEPFGLKYLGIGNEDLITDIFEERFRLIYNAVKEKHPEITIIGTVGPFSEGTDYVEGWALANELNLAIVDEHYYQPPGWFIYNQDFYDTYDRSASKVYLGEYASWGNTLYNALAEALYLTAVERNGDVVQMASYAPLLAREGHTQWRTDLIFFNGSEVKPTVNYYVQKLFGQNAGDEYLESRVVIKEKREGLHERVAISTVRDLKSSDMIIKLVNLLPVPVIATLDMNDIKFDDKIVRETILSGHPDNKQLKPRIRQIELKNNGKYEIEPYSLTVLRLSYSK